MLKFDESIKSCECKSGIVVDHEAKTISCSECGRVFGGDSTAKAGSSDDFLPFTSENPQNRGSINTADLNIGRSGLHPVIAAISDRLGLPVTVKIKADEISKKLEHNNKRNYRNEFFAACIYVACRQVKGMTRSMSEISSATIGASVSDICYEISFIAEKLKIDKKQLANLKPSDFINRFCSALKMDSLAVKAAQIAAESSECVKSTVHAKTFAATIVYAIARHSDKKTLVKDISKATGVCESGIRQTYSDLFTHLSTIIPKCFATAKEREELGNGSP